MRSSHLSLALLLMTCVALVGCGKPAATAEQPATPVKSDTAFKEVPLEQFEEEPRLWVYTPRETKDRYPCIVIAAAGGDLLTGMKLSEGDKPEHLPYVEQGFMVVAYDVSGDPASMGNREAQALFAEREAGIANGKAAIDYALKNLSVDPDAIYAVGHSSAGTLALQLAAADPRVKACVAFAPVVDTEERTGADISDTVAKLSPSATTANLKCPVLLFVANDDENVAPETIYGSELAKSNPAVKVVTAASGGHYDSMISEGIPAAITWLKELKTK
jgi:pimeloyl-ACP methyl ester carboxylesterase